MSIDDIKKYITFNYFGKFYLSKKKDFENFFIKTIINIIEIYKIKYFPKKIIVNFECKQYNDSSGNCSFGGTWSNIRKKTHMPILLLQAWRDYSKDNLDWNTDYNDGHYVVAIGYNDTCLFFEDPSSVVRTYLTFEELETRWHDVDDNNKTKNHHVAVVIKGNKQFKSNLIIHMD